MAESQRSRGPEQPAHERKAVISVVTPLNDVVFWERVDFRLNRNRETAINSPHWDKERYPYHVLCSIKTMEDGSFQRFFYAAKRDNQHEYNFEINGDDRLVRTYILPRASYPDPEFATPAVGTPDDRFPKYVFASEFLVKLDDELDGVFVAVRRVFSLRETVAYEADQKNEAIARITRRIEPKGTVVGSIAPGRVVEVAPQNSFFDIKVTTELLGYQEVAAPGFFLRELTPMPTSLDYNFPPRLEGVEIHGVWAYANSSTAAQSYNEDFFFEIDMTDPAAGPYPGVVRRFLTDNPSGVMAMFPLNKITPKRDQFGMLKSWFNASTKGNSTFALARQFDTGRPSVHDVVVLPAEVNYSSSPGSTSPPGAPSRPAPTTLARTPGFASLMALPTFTVSVVPRPTAYGLWEVQVAVITFGTTLGSYLYDVSASP